MADKLTRKELKAPDAFQKVGGEASSWLLERQQLVIGGVLVALVAGGGAALASYIGERGNRAAARELGAALEPLSRPVEGDSQTPAVSDAPAFKTEKEKLEATEKSLSQYVASHQGPSNTTAQLPLGQVALRLGKYDEAIAAFDAFLKDTAASDPLRAPALEGRGYALEAKGQLDEAIAAFEKLAQENQTELLKGMGQYHRARILIQQNKKEEAAKALSEIPAVAPNSAAARLASERLAALTTEGVKVPPPAAAAAGQDGGTGTGS